MQGAAEQRQLLRQGCRPVARRKLEERKAIYGKIAEKELNEGSIIYLYHRLVIIAHTAKLDGYSQLPDGLVRVVGVKLKP
jgi:peptide/nickel transport system substrate-binding protein